MKKNINTRKTPVKDYVIGKIISGEIKPGEKINESKICEILSLSKSPVREAITELVSDGILVNENFKGTSVGLFNDKIMIELATLRSALEVMAVDFAIPKIDSTSRNALMDIVEKMKIAAEEGNLEHMVQLDMEYHCCLIEISGNSTILAVWERIYNKLRIHFHQKNMLFKDLTKQYRDHARLTEYFTQESVYVFKQLLIEHTYYYLK